MEGNLKEARSIWLVIPCYNEAARLPVDTFSKFAKNHPNVHFLFVNDGSSDATKAILTNLVGSLAGQGRLLNLVENVGKAEAVRQGMLAARNATSGGNFDIGYWDADLATPLEEIPRFQEILSERPQVHLVMGARVKLLGRSILRNPWRHYLGRVFATVAANVLGFAVYDTQCGAKILRQTAAIDAICQKPFHSRWVFDVELIARLKKNLQSSQTSEEEFIYELPLTQWHDIQGSKVKPWDFVVALYDLFTIYLRYQVKT